MPPIVSPRARPSVYRLRDCTI